MKPFQESIMDALEQFKRQNHVEKLKTQITSESIPTDHKELINFLYLQIICIWWALMACELQHFIYNSLNLCMPIFAIIY